MVKTMNPDQISGFWNDEGWMNACSAVSCYNLVFVSAGSELTSLPGPNFPSSYSQKVGVSSPSRLVYVGVCLPRVLSFLTLVSSPTGTCVNNTSVLMFKKGSFEVRGTIHPVAIKVRVFGKLPCS